jgi:hypothetical protein
VKAELSDLCVCGDERVSHERQSSACFRKECECLRFREAV